MQALVFGSETDLLLNPQVWLIFCHLQLYSFNLIFLKWSWSISPWDWAMLICQKTKKEVWTLITANQMSWMLQDNGSPKVLKYRFESIKAPEFPSVSLSYIIWTCHCISEFYRYSGLLKMKPQHAYSRSKILAIRFKRFLNY